MSHHADVLASSSQLRRALCYGVIVPRLQRLYEWSAPREPSTWHMTLVFFGFRYEGALPTEQDLKLIRVRRVVALGLIVMLVLLAFAAFVS